MHILVTGSGGFIGHALCRRLLSEGHVVTGFDGLTELLERLVGQVPVTPHEDGIPAFVRWYQGYCRL